MVDTSQVMFLPTSKSHDTKNEAKYKKSGPDKLYVLCPNLRMHGHLPAPIVNGGGDSLWKWPNFRLSRARNLDLDLGSNHTAHCHASLIDLYQHTKFHWNRRNVLWTDGRTDVRTGGRTFETHFVRSTPRSRPKNSGMKQENDICCGTGNKEEPRTFIAAHETWITAFPW